jgi:hypothetical protein
MDVLASDSALAKENGLDAESLRDGCCMVTGLDPAALERLAAALVACGDVKVNWWAVFRGPFHPSIGKLRRTCI